LWIGVFQNADSQLFASTPLSELLKSTRLRLSRGILKRQTNLPGFRNLEGFALVYAGDYYECFK